MFKNFLSLLTKNLGIAIVGLLKRNLHYNSTNKISLKPNLNKSTSLFPNKSENREITCNESLHRIEKIREQLYKTPQIPFESVDFVLDYLIKRHLIDKRDIGIIINSALNANELRKDLVSIYRNPQVPTATWVERVSTKEQASYLSRA